MRFKFILIYVEVAWECCLRTQYQDAKTKCMDDNTELWESNKNTHGEKRQQICRKIGKYLQTIKILAYNATF